MRRPARPSGSAWHQAWIASVSVKLDRVATETTSVVTSLNSGREERGLSAEHGLLVVLDGAKALRKAVRDCFGERALVQRCQVHKLRNVLDKLPERERPFPKSCARLVRCANAAATNPDACSRWTPSRPFRTTHASCSRYASAACHAAWCACATSNRVASSPRACSRLTHLDASVALDCRPHRSGRDLDLGCCIDYVNWAITGFRISPVVLAVALLLIAAGPAMAHFSTGDSTHTGPSGCNTQAVDRILMVFTAGATSSGTKSHIAAHTGWAGTSATVQLFKTHNPNSADPDGTCLANTQSEQLASSGNPRFHVRFKQTFDSSPTYGTTTIATPQKEATCGGGHRITNSPSGFVEGRTTLRNAMVAGGHTEVAFGFWANDNPMPQCGGVSVASDGFVSYISI